MQCVLLFLVLVGNSALFWFLRSYTLLLQSPVLMRSWLCAHVERLYTLRVRLLNIYTAETLLKGTSEIWTPCLIRKLDQVLTLHFFSLLLRTPLKNQDNCFGPSGSTVDQKINKSTQFGVRSCLCGSPELLLSVFRFLVALPDSKYVLRDRTSVNYKGLYH